MTDMHADVLVIGGGLSGSQLVNTLRDKGFEGHVILLSDEGRAPYHRPPLSKAYLEGSTGPDQLLIKKHDHYTTRNIDLLLDVKATTLDRDLRTVTLADGRRIGYGKLVLATGARNRPLPGLETSDPVFYLRTEADAAQLKARAADAASVAIIGGGFLGLEVAHVLRKSGKEVTVLEVAPRLLARTSSPPVSEAVLALHANAGIRVIRGDAIQHIQHPGAGVHLRLASGAEVQADMLVVSIGVLPNVELAAAAGLAVDNGIVVDEFLATSDPHIFAVGDCANFPSRHGLQPLRIESVQNAMDQARCVAAALCGDSKPFDVLPTFWSDQGTRIQISGIVATADRYEVRGDVDSFKFSVYGFREGRLVSVESLGQPTEHMAARKLLAAGQHPTPEEMGFAGG